MNMLPRDMQLANEYTYSRKFIDEYIDKAIRGNPDMEDKVQQGVHLLLEMIHKDHGYASKNARIAQLLNVELEPLVRSIYVAVAYCQMPVLFTSLSSQLAGRLRFSEKLDGIKTIADILAELCNTDAFDIQKEGKYGSLHIVSRIPLENKLLDYIRESTYLPPMVCEPEELINNFSSGYLTHNDSVILGAQNHHSGDVCLDVLNLCNKVALSLDVEFLSTLEEAPKKALDTNDKVTNWHNFKLQSYKFYTMLVKQGNKFYLTHKVDKRLRIYAQGYHISTQGSSFKKASIELHKKEVVTGVPTR